MKNLRRQKHFGYDTGAASRLLKSSISPPVPGVLVAQVYITLHESIDNFQKTNNSRFQQLLYI